MSKSAIASATADYACARRGRPLIRPTRPHPDGAGASGENFNAMPLMQYRSPVGGGPSSNTCPKWPPHRRQCTSVRGSSRRRSVEVSTALGSGRKKLGPGLAALRPGAIVLMHVGQARDGSLIDPHALPAVIDAIRRRGYSFTTLEPLLGRSR